MMRMNDERPPIASAIRGKDKKENLHSGSSGVELSTQIPNHQQLFLITHLLAMMRRRRCLHGHIDILTLGLVSHFQQRHQTDAVPCTSAQQVRGNGILERHFGSEFRRCAARHARRALCLAFDTICALLTRALCVTHGTAHTHTLCEDGIRKQGVPFESCPTSNSSAFFSLWMLLSAASKPHSDGYMSREEPVPRRGRHRQILETKSES